jgi:hypothetical protein
MRNIRLGEWEIEVDAEATREYYARFDDELANRQNVHGNEVYSEILSSILNTEREEQGQLYRNYKKFCQALSEEESDFFRLLGIDPESVCGFRSPTVHDDNTAWCIGAYHVFGAIRKTPESVRMLNEGTIPETGLDLNAETVQAGRFYFTPHCMTEYNTHPYLSKEKQENLCAFRFSTIVPWILEEKCLKPTQLRWWEKIYIDSKAHKLYAKEWFASLEKMLTAMLEPSKIRKLNKREIIKLRERWHNRFVPSEFQQKSGKENLKGISNAFFWGAYIRDSVPCLEGEQALAAFDAEEKDGIYILPGMMSCDYKLALYVEGPVSIKASDLNKIEELYVIDKDFTYNYIHMHENIRDIGSYFYRKE